MSVRKTEENISKDLKNPRILKEIAVKKVIICWIFDLKTQGSKLNRRTPLLGDIGVENGKIALLQGLAARAEVGRHRQMLCPGSSSAFPHGPLAGQTDDSRPVQSFPGYLRGKSHAGKSHYPTRYRRIFDWEARVPQGDQLAFLRAIPR
jgi:hypothetical protein